MKQSDITVGANKAYCNCRAVVNVFRTRRSTDACTCISLYIVTSAIVMPWGNTAYCVKPSGEDLSRYSNKIESVGLKNVGISVFLQRK